MSLTLLYDVGHTRTFPKYYIGATLFFIGLGEIVGKYLYSGHHWIRFVLLVNTA